MTPAIISALAGTSGLIGLLALLAYFFYSYQVRKLELSVRRTIEGESPGLFNAEQVVDILRTFETAESRLAALKQLIGVDDRAAKRVYGKIEGSINLSKWTDQDPKKRARTSLIIGLFFVLIALIGLAYSAIAPKLTPTILPTPPFSPSPIPPVTPPTPTPTPTVTSSPSAIVSPTASPIASATQTALPTSTTTPTPDRFANFGDDFWEIVAAYPSRFSKITGTQIPGRHHESCPDHLPTNVWDSFTGTRTLGEFTDAEVFHQTSTSPPPESRLMMEEDRYEFRLVDNVKTSIADSLFDSVVSHIAALLKKDPDSKADGGIDRVAGWNFGTDFHIPPSVNYPVGAHSNPLFITLSRSPSPGGHFQVTLTFERRTTYP